MTTLKKDKLFKVKIREKCDLQLNIKRKAIQKFKRLRRKANKVVKALDSMNKIVADLTLDFPEFTITISNEVEE